MNNERGSINYAALFCIVALAVASGNLISNWVTAKAVEYKAAQIAEQVANARKERVTKAHTKQADERAKRQTEAAHEKQQMRNVRAGGKLGKRLIRECQEWTEAAHKNPSASAEREANRRCTKKEQYLNSGTWSPKLGN